MKNKDIIDILKRTYSDKAPDILDSLRFDKIEISDVPVPRIRHRYIAAVAIYTAACLVAVSVIPFVIGGGKDHVKPSPADSDPTIETIISRQDEHDTSLWEDLRYIEETADSEITLESDNSDDNVIKIQTNTNEVSESLEVTEDGIITDATTGEEVNPPAVKVTETTASQAEADVTVLETEVTVSETELTAESVIDPTPDPIATSVFEAEPEPVKLTYDEVRQIAIDELAAMGISDVKEDLEVTEYDDYNAYRVEFADKNFMDHGYVPASDTGIGNRPESSVLELYDYEYRYVFTIDYYTGEVEYSNTVFTGEDVEGTTVKSNFYIKDSIPYTHYIHNGIGMPELSKAIASMNADSTVISFENYDDYNSFIEKLRVSARSIPKDKLGAGAMNFLYQDNLFDTYFFESNNLYFVRLSSGNAFDYYNIDSITANENGLSISITSIKSNTPKVQTNEQYLLIAVEKEKLTDSVNADCKIDNELDINIDEAEAKELSGNYGCSKVVIEATLEEEGYTEEKIKELLDINESALAAGNANVFDYSFEYMQSGNTYVYVTDYTWMPHFETAYNIKCVINAADGSLIDCTVSDPIDDYTPPTREVYVPRIPYDNDKIMYTRGVTYSYYEYSDESISVLQSMIDLDTSEHNVKHSAGYNPDYKSVLGFNNKTEFDSFVSEFDSADLDGYTNSEAEAFLKDLEKYDEEYFRENNLYLISLENEDPSVHYIYWMQVKFPRRTSSTQFEPYLTLDAIGVDYGIRTGEKLNKLVLFEVSREEVFGTSNLEVFYIEKKYYPNKDNIDNKDTVKYPYVYHPKKYYYLTKDN